MAADNPIVTVRTDKGQGIEKHQLELNTWANTVNAEIAALEAGAAAITEVTGGGPAYTVVPADRVILANSAAGVIQLNLPVSAGLGRTITVLRDGGSNVTIQAQAGESVDGALTLVLTDDNTGVDVIDTGAATGTDEWDATGANVTGLAGVIAAAALNTTHRTSDGLSHSAIGRLFPGAEEFTNVTSPPASPLLVAATTRLMFIDATAGPVEVQIPVSVAAPGMEREILYFIVDNSFSIEFTPVDPGDEVIGPFGQPGAGNPYAVDVDVVPALGLLKDVGDGTWWTQASADDAFSRAQSAQGMAGFIDTLARAALSTVETPGGGAVTEVGATAGFARTTVPFDYRVAGRTGFNALAQNDFWDLRGLGADSGAGFGAVGLDITSAGAWEIQDSGGGNANEDDALAAMPFPAPGSSRIGVFVYPNNTDFTAALVGTFYDGWYVGGI